MATGSRLVDVLPELLDLVDERPPTAAEVEARLRTRATARSVAGPNLEMPTWARAVGGADDVYLTLDGDLLGARVHDDPRGWGAYADLAVRAGTLDDVESVVGPTSWMARNPDDFSSGERVAAYVDRSGWTVRVFTELTKDGTGVREVTISYPGLDASRRSPGEPAPFVIRRPLRPPGLTPAESAPASLPDPDDTGDAGDAGGAERCQNCGADIRDAGSFCGSCGAFLEWSRG
jgi:hypothetical protein